MFPSLSCCPLMESLHEVVAASPINFLDQARNIFVVGGRGESTHKSANTKLSTSFFLPATGRSILIVMRLLPPPLIVVSALLGGCNTTGSLPSTGSSEPGEAKQQTQPLDDY